MDYLFQGGGKPGKTKSKTGTKTTKPKTSTKTGTKNNNTTKSKSSSKKGGNFLGAVGDLVAPTGWGPFATAAGLLALDRADAALRRGKSTKSSAKKGGMRGGFNLTDLEIIQKKIIELDGELGELNKNYKELELNKNYKEFLKIYSQYAENKKTGNFIPDNAKFYWSIFGNMLSLLYSILFSINYTIDVINQSNQKNKYLELKKDIEGIISFIKNEQENASKLNKFNKYNRRIYQNPKVSNFEKKSSLLNWQNLYKRFAKDNIAHNSKFRDAIKINKLIIEQKHPAKNLSDEEINEIMKERKYKGKPLSDEEIYKMIKTKKSPEQRINPSEIKSYFKLFSPKI